MSSQRSLLEIFENLKHIAGQNLTKQALPHHTLSLPHNQQQNGEELSCLCEERKDAIYIKKEENKFIFAVCPACNPRLVCHFCYGTGHRNFLKHQHVIEENKRYNFEEISPYTCSCTESEKIAQRLNEAQIPEKYLKAEFDSLDKSHLNQISLAKMEKNITNIISFCTHTEKTLNDEEEPPNHKYFLTFFGPVGTGKTLLSVAALKLLICDFKKS
ncbi:MAG: PhoH family protein, partial [Silvanigrellaceae bacterium]|nr:PhoH family protein [Silvanigrellaceae bacterium]